MVNFEKNERHVSKVTVSFKVTVLEKFATGHLSNTRTACYLLIWSIKYFSFTADKLDVHISHHLS